MYEVNPNKYHILLLTNYAQKVSSCLNGTSAQYRPFSAMPRKITLYGIISRWTVNSVGFGRYYGKKPRFRFRF